MRITSPRGAVLAATAALALAACGSSSNPTSGAVAPSASPPSTTQSTTTGPTTPTSTGTGTTPSTTTGPTTPTSTGTGTTPSTTPGPTSTTAASGNLTQFKADILHAQKRGRTIGTALSSTLARAGKLSSAKIVIEFSALAKRVDAYADSVSGFPAPAQFQADYQLVVRGFHAVAVDLASIAKLASKGAGTQDGKLAIQKLYNDLQGLASAETTLDKAVGLPN